jgi:hypothetical protein
MRVLILVATAAFALSACGNNDQTDNTQNVDENLTAENIVSNDVTAIDAVTGDDANMAADVDYSNLADNSLDNISNDSAGSNPPVRASHSKSKTTEPVASAADNSAANTSE